MEVKRRRVSDLRDCTRSSDVVIILDTQHSTNVEVPFSPNSFFSKLSKEARKICTSLQEEGGVRKKRITDESSKGRHSNLLEEEEQQHSCVDGGRVPDKNARRQEERGSNEPEAEKT